MSNGGAVQVTIVGLGPGAWETLTLEAVETMRSAGEVYVRTALHPSLQPIRAHLPEVTFHDFDDLYSTLPDLGSVYSAITDRLMAEVEAGKRVVYAVPGSPSLGESTVRMLRDRVQAAGGALHLVQGLSAIEPMLGAAGISDAAWIQALDASDVLLMSQENAVGQVPDEEGMAPWRAPVVTVPTLISYLYDRATAAGVKRWLSRFYPEEHKVLVLQAPGTDGASTQEVPLYELDRLERVDHRTALLIPPLPETENVRTFAGLMNVTRALRAPGGCPWDREQTHASLKPYLLEEAYEVVEALDANDVEMLVEELGDLLYQITIHSQVAAEAEEFTIEDVLGSITTKMIARHPHVFQELELETAQDVRNAWEGFKQKEKPKRASILEQIPRSLPALPQSNLMQKRAASVGFEWPTFGAVLDKVEEELAELRREVEEGAVRERQREEFGDILFALVSAGRHLKIDPEEALRLANRKFAARFQYVESRVSALGRSLRDLSPSELDTYWDEAKALGTARAGHRGENG